MQWWQLALEHARELVLQDFADTRQALSAEYDELHALRQTFADEAAELRSKTEAALQAERLASTQVVELQRLVSQMQAQIDELSQQRTDANHLLDTVGWVKVSVFSASRSSCTANVCVRSQLLSNICVDFPESLLGSPKILCGEQFSGADAVARPWQFRIMYIM